MTPDALHQLRLGEIKNAAGLIAAETVAAVTGLPIFYDALKLPMPARRALLAAALKTVAGELTRAANEVAEGK